VSFKVSLGYIARPSVRKKGKKEGKREGRRKEGGRERRIIYKNKKIK
jgi:hypothetical protein